MTALVLVKSSFEKDEGHHLETTSKLVSAARKLDTDVHVLVLDRKSRTLALEVANLAGVSLVHVAISADPELVGLDETALQLATLMQDYETLITSNDGRGKHVLPLLAARLQIPPLSGISAILGDQMFERPIYAGSLMERVQLSTQKNLLSIRTVHFSSTGEQPSCPIIEITAQADASVRSTEIIDHSRIKTGRPDLANADIVVAGGRGLGSAENFAKLETLADALGAAIGASRIAVDMGWAPHNTQVGQTGVQIAPKLYIAIGISGAVQHIAGIKDAGTIVAVNKDPDAPIFRVADHGIVGDLHEVLPELQKALENIHSAPPFINS